jgi:hypothetical protein
MRELFLPFRQIRPLVFHRGISTGSGVPPTGLLRLPFFSSCALQPFFAAVVISSPVTAARCSRSLWRERARSFPRTRGPVLR